MPRARAHTDTRTCTSVCQPRAPALPVADAADPQGVHARAHAPAVRARGARARAVAAAAVGAAHCGRHDERGAGGKRHALVQPVGAAGVWRVVDRGGGARRRGGGAAGVDGEVARAELTGRGRAQSRRGGGVRKADGDAAHALSPRGMGRDGRMHTERRVHILCMTLKQHGERPGNRGSAQNLHVLVWQHGKGQRRTECHDFWAIAACS
eukprot:297846-Chlamydomonas_euryale.AAC.20